MKEFKRGFLRAIGSQFGILVFTILFKLLDKYLSGFTDNTEE